MLVILLMIIMAIIAASGFVVLGLSFIGHKLRIGEKREDEQRKRATPAIARRP